MTQLSPTFSFLQTDTSPARKTTATTAVAHLDTMTGIVIIAAAGTVTEEQAEAEEAEEEMIATEMTGEIRVGEGDDETTMIETGARDTTMIVDLCVMTSGEEVAVGLEADMMTGIEDAGAGEMLPLQSDDRQHHRALYRCPRGNGKHRDGTQSPLVMSICLLNRPRQQVRLALRLHTASSVLNFFIRSVQPTRSKSLATSPVNHWRASRLLPFLWILPTPWCTWGDRSAEPCQAVTSFVRGEYHLRSKRGEPAHVLLGEDD